MADPNLDPILTCTELEMAFAAWQTAQGRADQLSRAGNAWEAFHGWWNGRDMTYFANRRQLARAAWNASSNMLESQQTLPEDVAKFNAFWNEIVATGQRIGSV